MAQVQRFNKTRIASYNIRKAKGLDQRRDAGRILDILNKSGADVIALQEADLRMGKRKAAIPFSMIDDHTDYEIAPIAENDVSLGWHGNAILLRKGLEICSIKRIELPSLEPRGAVQLSLSNGLSVTSVHLGLSRNFRRKQIEQILACAPKRTKAIILGDFNEWSKTRGLEKLSEQFEVHAPGKTFHSSRPLASLDRIATSNDMSVIDAGVIDTKLTRIASDHLPIWADVNVRNLSEA